MTFQIRHCSNYHLAIAFVMALLALTASAQSTVVGKNCDLKSSGAKSAKAFLAFDSDLRNAIAKEDVGKVALLVYFPLRVNDEKGSFYIHDASSLQGRFQDVFPAGVRQTILNSAIDSTFCNSEVINYAQDELRISAFDRGYSITAINLPSSFKPRSSADGAIELACSTGKHRILIDLPKDRTPRYRSWNLGHALAEGPDLEIAKGTQVVKGSGMCAHKIWTFHNGETEYVIESAEGCPENVPPKDAHAELRVTLPGRSDPATSWCY